MKLTLPPLLDHAAMRTAAEALRDVEYGAPYEGLPFNCAVATAHVLTAGGVRLERSASIAPPNPLFEADFKGGVRATQLGPFAWERNGVGFEALSFLPAGRDYRPTPGRELILHHHMPEREPTSASEHVLPVFWQGDRPWVFDARPSARAILPFEDYVARHIDDTTYGKTAFHVGFLDDLAPYDHLADLMRNASHVLVMTGAGMSAESGLSTFRGKDGAYTTGPIDGVPVEELASITGLHRHYETFAKFYRRRIESGAQLGPNTGHHALSRLQQAGYVHDLVTQNVDGFHQAAGMTNVKELHGTLRTVHCQACGHRRAAIDFLDERLRCACGGPYRPSVVLFGEPLPPNAIIGGTMLAAATDLLLVLGTTLLVHPATEIPTIALNSGAKLAIVNLGETPFDDRAHVVLPRRIGETLLRLERRLQGSSRSA